MNRKPEPYDQTAAFEEIAKELDMIAAKCYLLKIPFFAAAALKEDGEHTEYRYNLIRPPIVNRSVSEDKITKCALVLKGYDVKNPKTESLDSYLFMYPGNNEKEQARYEIEEINTTE